MRAPLCCVLLFIMCLAGCDSGGSESEHEEASGNSPPAQTVRSFYGAANRPDGNSACSLLTERGIAAIVHVQSRAACIRTIDALEPGSFDNSGGKLLSVEGVEEHGDDAFDVDAALKGRSGGTYRVIRQNGKLLIDDFESDEG